MRQTVAVEPYVPMPNTCHPHYENMAEGIRAQLGLRHIVVAEIQQAPLASFDQPKPLSDALTQRRTLTVKKVAGGAPFVGDPMRYQGFYCWFAAVDDLGRHVAGEATLEIAPRWDNP